VDGDELIQTTPGGLAWAFEWGSLRHTCNGVLFALADVSKEGTPAEARHRVVCWAKGQLDYVLGLSGKRSFVVNFGESSPCRPHHRASSCPTLPGAACGWDAFNADACNPNAITGALVGGPGADDSYVDDRKDFKKNEVALDYNAGFTSALAGLLELLPDEDCYKL
jgi:hypothetical protein